MTAQELKNSILQLAVQGKLVPQCKDDEPASELLKRIRAEKEKLGIKGKSLSEITEEEKPFDIPDSWEWVRLGVLGILKSGYAFKSAEYTDKGIQVVRISDLGEDCIMSKSPVYYKESKDLQQYLITQDSFLICMTGSIGKMAWVKDAEKRYLNQRVGMFELSDKINKEYVWMFLHSAYVISKLVGTKTSLNGNIKNANINELLTPLPPLAEQKRIVEKIEELMPLIEKYGKAEDQLSKLNAEFSDKLRKSILQQAVQGRLVSQNPNDEPASELLKRICAEKSKMIAEGKNKKGTPVLEIDEDEIPFEIPESWVWVRFLSVVDIKANLVSPSEYLKYLHIAPDNIEKSTGRLLECRTVEEDKVASANHLFFEGQIIYSKIRPLLRKAVIAPFKGLCSADMYPLDTYLDKKYVLYYLLSDACNKQISKIIANRVKMPKINQNELSQVLFPLPPLAEQKRIVKRVEELLALCDESK